MHIEAAHRTDVGRVRDHNEDFVLVDEGLGLYVVCDGMGGHAAGEVASMLCARTILETVQAAAPVDDPEAVLSPEETVRLEEVLRSAVENANAQIHDLGNRDRAKHGAGTTCTALLIRNARGFMAHVGDTRLYLKRHGQLHQISSDHSALEVALRSGMPREEAEAAFTSNMLARAIGPHKVVIVDTMAFDVLPEDTYFICSDGLHGYLEDADELSAHLDGDLDALNETLIALANERGGKDNISTIALRIHAGEAAPADETQRHSRIIEDLAALSQMQLFSEMAYPELLEIAEALEGAAYEAEQVIVTEGDESDCLYVISTGAVRVERQGQVIATLAPGCHFGEMALLTSRPRSATVIAAEPTRLLALTRATIYELFERRPAIGMKFLWTLAQVQSFRLDEALLQRTTAEPPAVSSSAPPPAKPPASPARARPTLDQTLQGFPAPLSRRVS